MGYYQSINTIQWHNNYKEQYNFTCYIYQNNNRIYLEYQSIYHLFVYMTCETIHYKNHTLIVSSYSVSLSKSWIDKQKDQGQTNYNFILLENFERDSEDLLPLYFMDGNYR